MKVPIFYPMLFLYFLFSCYGSPSSAQIPKTPPEKKPDFIKLLELRRIGAVCNDGTRSQSTGKGTCSRHGGVDYWLYTEAPVYEAYSQNLPAIPDGKLLPIEPEMVENLIRLGGDILLMPDPDDWKEFLRQRPLPDKEKNAKSSRKKKKDRAREKEDDMKEEEEPEKIIPQPQKRNKRNYREPLREWPVMDFLIPFVIIAALLCLFVLVYWIIRKLL